MKDYKLLLGSNKQFFHPVNFSSEDDKSAIGYAKLVLKDIQELYPDDGVCIISLLSMVVSEKTEVVKIT